MLEQLQTPKQHIRGLKYSALRVDAIAVNVSISRYSDSVLHHPDKSPTELPSYGLLGAIPTYVEQIDRRNIGTLDMEQLHLSPEETVDMINHTNPPWEKPPVVLMNALTPSYPVVREVVNGLRGDIQVVIGGAHARAMPEYILRELHPKVRFIGMSDGEFVAKAFLDGISPERIGAVAYLDANGEFHVNPSHWYLKEWTPQAKDLNEMPLVDRKFLAGDLKTEDGRTEAVMVGARGCPFECSFCSAARSGSRRISPGRTIEEMQILNERYGVTAFRFIDDLFISDVRSMNDFTNAVIANPNLKDNIVWDATGRANILAGWATRSIANLQPGESIKKMQESGCREIAIGVESGNERILQLMAKKNTKDKVRLAVTALAQVGIRVKGYFILGSPSETREEMQETLDFAQELRELALVNGGSFRASMFELRPYPGTMDWFRLTGEEPYPDGTWDNLRRVKKLSAILPLTKEELSGLYIPAFDGEHTDRSRFRTTPIEILDPLREVSSQEIQATIEAEMAKQMEFLIENGAFIPERLLKQRVQNRGIDIESFG